ncbi:MAG: RNA methyltransferase [Chitinophagaceae bacterium]
MSVLLPPAFLESIASVPGFDREAFIAAHQSSAPVSVRLHPQKGNGLWDDLPVVPWCSDGRYLPERPLFTGDPLFHAGAYYVQEASSMLLAAVAKFLFGGAKNLRVLDLCAAPGGKSTLLASMLEESSLLISNDVIRNRATILEESMIRWGYTNTWVTSNDPRDFGRMPGYFDVVLVDAPCSGSGLFRKDAGAMKEWSVEAVTSCSLRQQRILADVWPCLKENGILIYATCSYSSQEDEAICDWLADEFSVEGIPLDFSMEWGVVESISSKNKMLGYRCFPNKVQGEGFFISAFRKLSRTPAFYYKSFRAAKLKRAQEASLKLLRSGKFSILEDARRAAFAVYPWHEPDYHFLQELVYLRKPGIRLGMAAQKDWIPEHDVALSLDKNTSLPQWNMSKEVALAFLKKESIEAPPNLGGGWMIASYEGRSLGWVKVLANRVNNYLPKHWKIRMEIPDLDAGKE